MGRTSSASLTRVPQKQQMTVLQRGLRGAATRTAAYLTRLASKATADSGCSARWPWPPWERLFGIPAPMLWWRWRRCQGCGRRWWFPSRKWAYTHLKKDKKREAPSLLASPEW